MVSLVLMYVYFDAAGDIKAITPTADLGIGKDYEHTMLPLSEVEAFLIGKKSTFDYVIKGVKKLSGKTYKLTKKFSNVNLSRSLDSYLTKISSSSDIEPAIRIYATIKWNRITLQINPSYKELYDIGLDEEKEKIDEFLSSGVSHIYITEKGNPYNLFYTVSFLPKDLYEKEKIDIKLPDEIDLRNSGAYTKRLVSSYSYAIREY